MKPKPKSKPQYVWCVLYSYDYEGESLEAVYDNHRSAKLHPGGGDETIIRKPETNHPAICLNRV